jgi:L-lysine exporter family protein LysE/ArgO
VQPPGGGVEGPLGRDGDQGSGLVGRQLEHKHILWCMPNMNWSSVLRRPSVGAVLALLAGLGTGLSLIVAIGAQNAYVLRQGLRREHVVPVVAVCAVSDLLLITLGVAGVGTLIAERPVLLTVVRYAGAAFLVGYAVLALRRAATGGRLDVTPTGPGRGLGPVLATGLALTWLNPHVYLDTVLLLGTLATTHGSPGRWWFATGAGLGSIAWFSALGLGARLLRPLFARPLAWRLLDLAIAATVLAVAASLLLP